MAIMPSPGGSLQGRRRETPSQACAAAARPDSVARPFRPSEGGPPVRRSGQIVGLVVGLVLLAVPASALGSGWVYTESNNPSSGRNSVLALEYGSNGRLNPARIREYYTRGTGAALIAN